MRIRTVVLIVVAVLIVAFTLLNWQEFTRTTTLTLGFAEVIAPLGLILLSLLVLATLVFLAVSASTHTRYLMETRQQAKVLQAQRELAEKAETSRFVELRQYLEGHLRESRQRETQAATELEQAFGRIQRELRNQIEQMHRAVSMRLGEMEARLTQHVERSGQRGLALSASEGESSDSSASTISSAAAPSPSFDRVP